MKSKIEEKIKNAREATNEMFAAFEELNESLKEKELEKYLPQRGEYIFHKWADRNGSSASNIIILKSISDEIINAYVYFCSTSKNCVDLGLGLDGYVNRDDDVLLRPATPSEIALLDSKLAEQGKRFDKEKLELVDILKEPKFKKGDLVRTPDGYIFEVSEAVTNTMKTEWLYCKNPNVTYFGNYIEESKLQKWEPKHKEPIIGEMAIMWNSLRERAIIAMWASFNIEHKTYITNEDSRYKNAIAFESIEQYKAFLKS